MNQNVRETSTDEFVQAARIKPRHGRCIGPGSLFGLSLPLVLYLFLLPVSSSPAQEKVTATRIDLLVEQLEHVAREHHVPGIGLTVLTPDGVFTRGIGVADLKTGKEVTPQTIFEIGSITKSFTGVLVARLATEGKIDFDDPVREHVPYFHLKDPEADEKVTLRDLLCHRTGVTRTDSMLNGTEDLTLEDVVRQLAMAEPMAPFRQKFLYNNQMFLVAGLATEHAGGATYAELLDEYIFDPLDMESSTAVLSRARALADKRMSSGYRWLDAEQKYEAVPTQGIPLSEPAGAILSCPSDMARYLSFLLARGALTDADPLLPRDIFDDLWKIQIANSPQGGYGLGFNVLKWRGRTMVHHDGGIDGFTSTLALLPEEGIGLSLLTNAEFSAVPQMSIDIAFATLLGEEVQAVVREETEGKVPYIAEELQAFSGEFYLAGVNQVWIVFVNESGRLALDYPGARVYKLSWPDEAGRWSLPLAPPLQISFQKDEADAVTSLTIHNGETEVRIPRKRTTKGLPSVDEIFELTKKAMPPAAIERACPLRMEGTVELVHEGLSGRFELLYQDDEHWRFDKDFGKFGRITAVVDGDSGWCFTTMRGRETMSATAYATAKRDAPFSTLVGTRDMYRSFHVIDVEDEGDDKRILLRAIPLQGPPVTIRIDADGSVRRSDGALALGQLAMVPVETVYADIREVHGIRLAHHVEVRNPLTGTARVDPLIHPKNYRAIARQSVNSLR